jgi:hypothetical protein
MPILDALSNVSLSLALSTFFRAGFGIADLLSSGFKKDPLLYCSLKLLTYSIS